MFKNKETMDSMIEDLKATVEDHVAPAISIEWDEMVSSLLTSLADDCALCTKVNNKENRNHDESARFSIVDGALCTNVKIKVPEIRCGAEARNDDEKARNGIVDGALCTKTKSGASEVGSGTEARCGTENRKGDESETNTIVDDEATVVSGEDNVCYEEDAVEWDWEFAQQNVVPRKGRHHRILERLASLEPHNKKPSQLLERLAIERQNNRASKKQQSSLLLQKRLEKIYNREQMIRSLDTKLGMWNNTDTNKTARDDTSLTDSLDLPGNNTGLEVIHLEV